MVAGPSGHGWLQSLSETHKGLKQRRNGVKFAFWEKKKKHLSGCNMTADGGRADSGDQVKALAREGSVSRCSRKRICQRGDGGGVRRVRARRWLRGVGVGSSVISGAIDSDRKLGGSPCVFVLICLGQRKGHDGLSSL